MDLSNFSFDRGPAGPAAQLTKGDHSDGPIGSHPKIKTHEKIRLSSSFSGVKGSRYQTLKLNTMRPPTFTKKTT